MFARLQDFFTKLNSRHLFSLIGGAAVFAALVTLIVFVPSYQAGLRRDELRARAEELKLMAPSPEAAFQIERDAFQMEKELGAYENTARTILAQITGGLFLIIGVYFGWRNIRAKEEGNVTERFSQAVEMLGSEKMDVRLGAIYALERIANDSFKDHWTVMEVLTAFVRENSQMLKEKYAELYGEDVWEKFAAGEIETVDLPKLSTDIQAALTTISRRKWWHRERKDQTLDFTRAFLPRAIFWQAQLERANFINAQLYGASFRKAKLRNTWFDKAKLIKAVLTQADARQADFRAADASKAQFSNTDITGAVFFKTDLRGATFSSYYKEGTGLTVDQLKSANVDENTGLPHTIRYKLKELGRIEKRLSDPQKKSE